MKKQIQEITLALLLGLTASAHAGHTLTVLSDQDLRTVQGQDGVTVMGDLRIKTDAFVYTDTDATGGSIALNGISINGLYVKRYDILHSLPIASLLAPGLYTGGDVIQIAFPQAGLNSNLTPTLAISSITLGNGTSSFGALSLDKIDLQGTKRWLWSH